MILQKSEPLLQSDEASKAYELVIEDFLKALNTETDHYVLKDGAALRECYHSNRISENIRLDSTDQNTIRTFISTYCKTHNYQYRIVKDTTAMSLFMIHFKDQSGVKPLKVEIFYCRERIDASLVKCINGITVYSIDALCIQKALAYGQWEKLTDLYDISFMINTYFDKFSPLTIESVRSTIAAKGIEYFDYVFHSHHDASIDIDRLAGLFMNMYEKLGLTDSCEYNFAHITEEQKRFHDKAEFVINNVLGYVPELKLDLHNASSHTVSFSPKESQFNDKFIITFDLTNHHVHAYLNGKHVSIQELAANDGNAYRLMKAAIDAVS